MIEHSDITKKKQAGGIDVRYWSLVCNTGETIDIKMQDSPKEAAQWISLLRGICLSLAIK